MPPSWRTVAMKGSSLRFDSPILPKYVVFLLTCAFVLVFLCCCFSRQQFP